MGVPRYTVTSQTIVNTNLQSQNHQLLPQSVEIGLYDHAGEVAEEF